MQEGLRDREGVFGGQLKAGRGYFGEQLGSGGGQRGVFRGSRTVWGVREGVFQPPVTSRVSVSLVGSTSLHSLSLGGGGVPQHWWRFRPGGILSPSPVGSLCPEVHNLGNCGVQWDLGVGTTAPYSWQHDWGRRGAQELVTEV